MQSNRDEGNSEGVWEHDRFDDEEEEEEEVVQSPAIGRRSSNSGALETGSKLLISNLAFSVNDDDIKDLFEPLGDIKKAFVQYDKSGRSLQQATVVYARRASAMDAIKKYNNVTLDGEAMKISLVATAAGSGAGSRASDSGSGAMRGFRSAVNEATRITVSVPNSSRRGRSVGGRRVLSTRPARGGAAGGRGGRGGRGRGRGRQVTKEELDAEMDQYANGNNEEGEEI